MQHEVFLEDFAFYMEKSSVALYLTHFGYLRHHGCDSGTYLQSQLTKPGVFGPEAELKAIYCPRTREGVVVFVYHTAVHCYRVSVSCIYLCEPIFNQQHFGFFHLLCAAFGSMVCELENRSQKTVKQRKQLAWEVPNMLY